MLSKKKGNGKRNLLVLFRIGIDKKREIDEVSENEKEHIIIYVHNLRAMNGETN